MISKIFSFAQSWIGEKITAEGYAPEGDRTEAKLNASRFLADADEAGFSRDAIEQQLGDVEDYMAQAVEDANDDEVARLVAKDD